MNSNASQHPARMQPAPARSSASTPPTPARPDGRRAALGPTSRWLLALLLLLAMLAYFVQDRHRQALTDAASQTRNLVQVIESHLADELARIDSVLRYVARRTRRDALVPDQQQRLADLQASFPMIAGLSVFDAQGLLRYSSDPHLKGIRVADRAHFQRLRDNPGEQLAFSEAQMSRTIGQWSIVMVRALRDEGGRFLGTVNAVIAIDGIGRLLGTVDVGAGGVVLLRQSDSFKLIQRMPRLNEKDFNQPLPANNPIRQRIESGERAATLTLTASTDGVDRLASFKVMAAFPFYVQVALAQDDYLAAWRQEAVAAVALAAVLVAVFAMVVWRLQKSAALAQTALRELHDNETERQLAEQAVHSLLGRLQLLAEHLPGFVYQYQLLPDGSSAFPYASPGIETIYGLSPKDAALDARRVFAVLHPDDLARVGASIARSADTLTVWHDSYRVQHPDGRLLWVEGRSTPVRQPDGSTLWHGYIQDITERKQAEQALLQQSQSLANILWGTGVGTWEWNVQTGQTRFNERWADMIGYTLAELAPISIDTWTQHAHPDDLPASAAALAQHFSGASEAYKCESRMRHRDGHWIWVLDRGKLVSRSADGAPEWMAGTHWEITERKQAEQALLQQTEALARSNAELEQFAYVASHDLRQPLRMINSYLQLIVRSLDQQLDDDTREMMGFATDGAQRMDQMLVSLLEYSRVGRRGEPLTLLDSQEAVQEALHFLAPAIAEAQASVQLSGDWPQVLASRDEFTRLWQNLIDNAVKYRTPGLAPQVRVSVHAVPEGWRFCVADNGIGIDPGQFGRLFKVFQRLHARDQYEGSGIGLAVARKIVERHGGRIWVESAGAGQGSRFCFDLPVAPQPSPTAL